MNNKEKNLTDVQILRIKAEEKLKEQNKTTKPVNEADVEKLLHELQVHQIELEMLNEELHEANEVAEYDYNIEAPRSLMENPILNDRIIMIDNYRIKYSGDEAYLLEYGKTVERL